MQTRFFEKMTVESKNTLQPSTTDPSLMGKIASSKSFRIVLADDDDDDYDFFAEAILQFAPQVNISRALDGADLIAKLEREPDNLPDLIFLDLNMPCRNGFECLSVLKSMDQWKQIPVIIYSTSAFADQVDTTFKIGANLYVQKPGDYQEIKKTVKNILSLSLPKLLRQPTKENFLLLAK